MTCPNCAKRLPYGDRYCPYCGAAIPAPVRAPGILDWEFLVQWLVATLLPWMLVWALWAQPFTAEALPDRVTAGLLGTAIAALLMGCGQWLVLRPRASHSQWWAPALLAGWVLAALLYTYWPAIGGPEHPPGLLIAGGIARTALIGAVTALAQWAWARRFLARGHTTRWVLTAALIFGAVLGLDALAGAYGIRRGWFPQATFGSVTGGRAQFEPYDVLLAAVWGALLGVAEYPLIQDKLRQRVWWPIATCLGMAAAAAAWDGGMWALQEWAPAIHDFLIAPTGAAEVLAWAIIGLGLGAGQWLALGRAARLPAWWILITAAGTLGGWTVAAFALADNWLLVGALAAGLVASVPPWLAVRDSFGQAGRLPGWGVAAWLVVALALGPLAQFSPVEGWVGPMILTLALGLAPGAALAYQG